MLLTVLIRALAYRFESKVDLVCSGQWSAPLFSSDPNVANLYKIRSLRTPYWLSMDQRNLVRILRCREPGPTWYCETRIKGLSLLQMGGIPERLIVSARDCPIQPREHVGDYMLRLASVGLNPIQTEKFALETPAQPALSVPDEEVTRLDQWLRCRSIPGSNIILIQAGNKRTMKRGPANRSSNTKFWPIERWSLVLGELRKMHPNAPILLLGVDKERRLNAAIMRLARLPLLFNVAGELPIGRLLALQRRAAGMISVDTGPAHSAAAVGCPTIVLFGQADPVNYAPRGADALVECLSGSHDGNTSIAGIQTDDVLNAWKRRKRPAKSSLNVPSRVQG